MKKAEAAGGVANLSVAEQLAIASYQIDYTVMNKVAETTHNQGCGMGGNASFLDKTSTYQMYDEQGRALYTTLQGDRLVQKFDEDGNSILDDDGNPTYEYADGSGDYKGSSEDVLEQRGHQTQDENGNLLFTDVNGDTVTQIKDEEGNTKYIDSEGNELTVTTEDIINEDGTANTIVRDAEGNVLERQLTEYNNSDEFKNLENEMKNVLKDVENGKYPADINSQINEVSDKNITENNESEQNNQQDKETILKDDEKEKENLEEAA